MTRANLKETQGFTLIEMSVVLGVIGLIAGGVMMGKNMIRTAEVTSALNELQQYRSATQSFITQYESLPGDLYNASAIWTGALDGNGDQLIGLQTSQSYEMFQFWHQLQLAKLNADKVTGLAGPGGIGDHVRDINCPASEVDGACWSIVSLGDIGTGDATAFTGSYHNTFALGADSGPDKALSPALTGIEASMLDKKIDDGLPATGYTRALPKGNAYTPLCTTHDATNPAGARYTTSGTLNCSILVMEQTR